MALYSFLWPAFLFCLLAPTTVFGASALSCFSYLPFGYVDGFMRLPEKKEFCYRYGKRFINVTTNEFGGRYLYNPTKKQTDDTTVLTFGESQLLAMDWDVGHKERHHLYNIFPKARIVAYAAPNNGPYESLARIKRKQFKYSENTKVLVFGLNLSTDIFRVAKDWDPSVQAPLSNNGLQAIFEFPGLFDILLLKARLEGLYSGENHSTPNSLANLYKAIPRETHEKHLLKWAQDLNFTLLPLLEKSPQIRKTLLVYPPYWASSLLENEVDINTREFVGYACLLSEHGFFDQVLYMKFQKSTKLTADERHFANGHIEFKEPDC